MASIPTTVARLSPDSTYRFGVLLIFAAGLCWSTMGLGIRLMDVATAWQILFYRSLSLAITLFVVIAVRSKGDLIERFEKIGTAGVLGAIALMLAFSASIIAIQVTSVANAMFLFAAAPFIAALLARGLIGERLRTATWMAIGVGTIGILIMVAQGISAGHLFGNVAALLSAFGFAGFTVALRWGRTGDMLPVVCLAGFFAVVVAASTCLATGEGFSISAHDMSIAIGLGFGQLGLGLILCTIGARHVPAAEVDLISMTEVLLGPFWVWLFLGEKPSTYVLIGGGILLLAIAGNALSGMARAAR